MGYLRIPGRVAGGGTRTVIPNGDWWVRVWFVECHICVTWPGTVRFVGVVDG